MATNHGASSSSAVPVPPAPASELMFKERSEDESRRLQVTYGGDDHFIKLVYQILDSALQGDLGELKQLMVGIESVNVALRNDFKGGTPLILAALGGHVEIVKWIRDSRPERNMNAMDLDDDTALSVACWSETTSEVTKDVVTELLLAEDLDANEGGGRDPLQYTVMRGKDWSVIQKLLAWNSKSYPSLDIHYRDLWGITALHDAALGGNVVVIDQLLETYPRLADCLEQPTKLGLFPLHHAAIGGHAEATHKVLVLKPNLVNAPDTEWRLTPLHSAVLSNSPDTVKAILKAGGKELKVDQPDWKGATPLDYARTWYLTERFTYSDGNDRPTTPDKPMTRVNAKKMIEMLEGFDILGLRTERQVYVDSANAILVGAALIASVTFSSWLQPPLGLTPYYERQFLMPFPAPPNTYESYVAIKDHWTIEMFWVFNTLSFFFVVATILGGADAALPRRGLLLKEAVHQVRHAVLRACCLLVVSMVCVIGAFASAGFTVLPPVYKYQKNMIGSVCVGGAACIFVLWKVLGKVFSWTSGEEIREYFVASFVKSRCYFPKFRVFVQIKYRNCIRRTFHNA